MDERRPTEQKGGAPPGEDEVREKGSWAARAEDGVVPAELGGSDAQSELQPDDPELGSAVQGRPAASDEPATEGGVDLSAGDQADAVTDGAADVPDDAEPDLKDVSAAQRKADADDAAG